MGNSASSDIIYGFNLSDEIGEEIDCDRAREWEEHVVADIPEPAGYSLDHKLRTPEQAAEIEAWLVAKRDRLNNSARLIHWGYSDGDNYVVGIRLTHGDWDAPAAIEPDANGHVLTCTPGMFRSIVDLCAWLGIEVQPCKLLLLSSYG